MIRRWLPGKRRVAYGIAGSALLAYGALASQFFAHRPWTKPAAFPVQVDFDAQSDDREISVHYTVTNRSGSTILVLDQTAAPGSFDTAHPYGTPNPRWAYLEFAQDGWSHLGRTYKVILSRRVERFGSSLRCNGAALPYGRRLEAGATLSGSFRLPLPLEEQAPMFGGSDPKLKDPFYTRTVEIRDVELQIGWSPEIPAQSRNNLAMDTFVYEGRELWFFGPSMSYWLEPNQEIAASRTQPVRWKGRWKGLFYQ